MLHVRRFQTGDAPTIIALFRDTVRRINCRDYSPEQIRAWAPDEIDVQAFADKLADRFSLVAEIGNKIIGFTDLESSGHLDRLYVHADHQRCGIGRALLEALEAEALRQGLGRVFTEASITARPFFERYGYRVLQEQVAVFRGIEFINYRMEKHLSPKENLSGRIR